MAAAREGSSPRHNRSFAEKSRVPAILGIVLFLWFAATMVSCSREEAINGQEDPSMPNRSLEEVLQEHTDSLMAMSGVVGTAQGLCDGEPCIRVFVIKKSDQLMGQIPPQIEGYPVDVQETGEFRKLDPG
jgi:hypothetical protein